MFKKCSFFVLALGCVAASRAASIYVFSTTNPGHDNEVIAALQAEGHDAFLGQPITGFTNLGVISNFDAVYLQANFNWGFLWDDTQQQTMIDYVNFGGALITAEWILWMTGTTSYFQTLKSIFPSVETTNYDSAGNITFTQATANPLMNAGIPLTFNSDTTSIAGVRTYVTDTKPGATTFYSDGPYKAVTGWGVGNGRVVNFHTVNGTAQLQNLTFRNLLSNSFDWATNNPPIGPGIHGHVDLQDFVGSPAGINVSLGYANPTFGIGGGRVTVTLDANGNFTAPGPNIPGTYRVFLKASHWLRTSTIVQTAPNTSFNAGTFTVMNGDSDGDNEIGPGDFAVLSAAFGSSLGDLRYRPNADLDGDEEVGPSDFVILSQNFGETGE